LGGADAVGYAKGLLVAASNTTLSSSEDDGATWQPIALANLRIYSVSVHPKDAARIAFVVGNGVATTNDRGKTWKMFMFPEIKYGSYVRHDPVKPGALWVSIQGRLWRSDDGVTWRDASPDATGVTTVTVLPSGRTYALTEKLWATDDGGTSWTMVSGGRPFDSDGLAADADWAYIVSRTGGVARIATH
jgi:photosystem II stability/assembly factor-like uncharacterized protein